MGTITGLTAGRMLAIEAASIVRGIVSGNNLILTRFDGTTIDAGSVRGPQGIQGPPGSITSSPAGGALTGNYPNPYLATGSVTDVTVAPDNKDGVAGVASMRTLGTGAQQAAPGNHTHGDTGWVNCTTVAGDSPFAGAAAVRCQYRKVGHTVHVRIEKMSTAAVDRSTNTGGNFPNVMVFGAGTLPLVARPKDANVHGSGRIIDVPLTLVINTDGAIVWTGGFARNYASGSTVYADFVYMTDN